MHVRDWLWAMVTAVVCTLGVNAQGVDEGGVVQAEGDPVLAYVVTSAIAGLAVFLACKSARRS